MEHPEERIRGGTVVGLVGQPKPEPKPEPEKTEPKKTATKRTTK